MYSCLFSYARYSNASSGHYFSSLHQMKNSAPTVDIISDNRDEEPVAPSSAVGTFDSGQQIYIYNLDVQHFLISNNNHMCK